MKKRIISILLALSMTVSAGVSALAAPSDIPLEQRAMAVDTIKADKAIEAFESDLKKSNNYDKDRKSTRLNSSHRSQSRMPSSA